LSTLRNIYILVFVTISLVTYSQSRNRYKYELLGGIGPTNFLGELGGANRIGTHFVQDFDLSATRFCVNGGLKYKNHPYFGFKVMLAFAMLSGNDALTKEKFRYNRNLNFRAPVLELAVQGEFYFLTEKSKALYKISGINKKKREKGFTAYIFTGVGGFLYIPQAKYNGKWYKLRKLYTEGEGLSGGPEQYSSFNICIPIGMGGRYSLDKKCSVGGEISVRKTFTDHIDDVGTNYYDQAKPAEAYGPVAAALANPNLGDIPGVTNATFQRGEPKYKDAYMFFTVTVGYKFTKPS